MVFQRMSVTHSRACYRKIHQYKYQLLEDYRIKTGVEIPESVRTLYGWLNLTKEGVLTIKKGYCWDGPSGPTIDTDSFMLGSLVHDAFYQLIREMKLQMSYRDKADRLLQQLCLDDGMSKIRAWWVYWGVRLGGEKAAEPKPIPEKKYTP
jgi:hypothetical protein